MSVALTGEDVIILNERILRDFADGDIGVAEFPNNLVEVKTGKNGNSIYAFNATGKNATLKLRVLKGSSDDKFLNSEIASYKNDPSNYLLLIGELVKRIGDGTGNVTTDTYVFSGGIIQKVPGVKTNVEGDTEQGVTEYDVIFANADRTI